MALSTTSHEGPERRAAIWPWLLMPIVVLLVFCTLQRIQDAARAAAAQAGAPASAGNTSPATEP